MNNVNRQTTRKPWEVVIWTTKNHSSRHEFDTKQQAFQYANRDPSVYAVEIYGPNDEYYAA